MKKAILFMMITMISYIVNAQDQTVNGNLILPSLSSGNARIYTNNTGTASTGTFILQAGGISSGYGGGLIMYPHSHATFGGWVKAGISANSLGKFAVNTYGTGGGTDVFTVDYLGNGYFNGNVGIGVANPTVALDVSGSIKATGTLNAGKGYFEATSDAQIVLRSSDSWNGIDFKDVGGRDFLWFNGYYKTFSIGGGGSSVNGKKLHVEGGTSIGTGYKGNTIPTNGLAVEGNVGIGLYNPNGKLEVRGNSAVYSDFAGYNGVTVDSYLPNGKEPTLVISENVVGTLILATGGQVTYKGGISFGRGGAGIYSTNPNPAGSSLYGDILFHTTYWNGSNYNNADRMAIKQNGNVGIGTNSPSTTLEVNGIITSRSEIRSLSGNPGLLFNESDVNDKNWHMQVNGGDFKIFEVNDARTNWNQKMVVKNTTGNVGIGITAPTEKLEIFNTINTPGVISLRSQRNDAAHVDVGRISAKQATVEVARIGMLRAGHTNSGYLTFWTKQTNTSSLVESMRINQNGEVGIGTVNPNGWKLAVNGNIRAKEIKVQTGWSDFVFEKEYKLPTLVEVEKHIKEKGHLKDIPSANEVAKNGIFIGEMNSKLLQKIEELTLYTIQQEKEIQKLKKQDKRIEELEELVKKLLEEKK